jgi:hypothetical protein
MFLAAHMSVRIFGQTGKALLGLPHWLSGLMPKRGPGFAAWPPRR